ncbi:CHAT domain-containing protein [Mycena leptocephala]|nr:CHAT domain-containing protein [Mycena leptocephala]
MLKAAVALTADGHPDKPGGLNNLGNSLLDCFEQLGDLSNINKSVLMLEDAVQLTPDGHPDKPSRLSNLGKSLLGRFGRLGDLSDINKSVLMLEDAVQLTPDGHPDKPSRLSNLGNSLMGRFEQLGDLSDINKSVLMKEDAVQLTPDGYPDKPGWLNNLGNSLFRHFERLGDLSDINKSVLMFEDAVQLTPDGHPDKPSRLNNLGTCLWAALSGLVISATLTNGHPDKPSRLNNLGNSLLGRFERLGDLSDINKSVLMLEDAVQLTPDGHPDKPTRLNNLGNSLFRCFERLGDLSDINKSVLMKEDAVQLTPDGHPDKPTRLNNLGNSLFRCFERLGDLSDINKSVLMKEDAVQLTPDGHPDKPSRLNNLGNSLMGRFEWLGDLSDINNSVLMFEDAVQLTPDGHPDKPGWLNNLGNSLAHRFERLGDLSDINKSVLMFEDAVQLTPDGHPNKRYRLNNLGASAASLHLSCMLNNRLCQHTIQSGQKLGKTCHIHQPSSILHAYTTAIGHLPELAWLGLSITDRHHLLLQAGQVVRDAASAAIAAHDFQKAVEWLDQGRSVIWGQLLNLRTPVDDLRKNNPDLADELVSLSTLLETAGTRSNAFAVDTKPQSLQSIANQSHAHALQRNCVLQQIRELPGFERFLFSKAIPELSLVAKMGPVAITPVSQDLGRIWWCPTGPLAFLPIHAAGLYGKDQAFSSELSDFLISSYTPSLTALIQGYRPQSEPQAGLQLLAITQPPAEGQSYIPGTQKEIKCIEQHAKGKVPILWLDEDMATIEKVQEGMKASRWVHFACHGVQSTASTDSALLLARSSRLTLSNIINLSLPNADLAFLSACQTATGSKGLQDESVHLAAGMLLAGYRGVIGTMWSIMDNDAPQVAGDVYAHLLEKSPPDPMRAAEALHLAVQKL